ncbi:MAG: VOC family protein [Pseudomonadota bacterium]
MLKLDHLTVIAPTLSQGVEHVRDCIGIDVPFGTRHLYMGTHNHRLQLGNNKYLEIVALDPEGRDPGRARWFGVDDVAQVRRDWDAGRRLRGWVASTTDIDRYVADYPHLFGEVVGLPFDAPGFAFSIPKDGSLPADGAVPSLIDHKKDPTCMSDIPDLGARLVGFSVKHPDADALRKLYEQLEINALPTIESGSTLRYEAQIETPAGLRKLS